MNTFDLAFWTIAVVIAFLVGLVVSPKNNDTDIILKCKQYGVAVVDDKFVQCQVVPAQPVNEV